MPSLNIASRLLPRFDALQKFPLVRRNARQPEIVWTKCLMYEFRWVGDDAASVNEEATFIDPQNTSHVQGDRGEAG